MNRKLATILLSMTCGLGLNAQVAVIPFELEANGYVLLNVQVNENPEVLKFVLDTGASTDLVDMSCANRLNLKPNYQQVVQGSGGSTVYDLILNQKLMIDGKIAVNPTNLVIADLERLKRLSDSGLDGIVGYSLLSKYVSKLDYENEKLVLYNNLSDVNLEGYEAIPFELDGGIPIPQFDITIKLCNAESYTEKILFDSGAALTLMVNTPFNIENGLSAKATKRIISRSENMNKQSVSEEIAISSLSIGNFKFNDLTVHISCEEAGVSAMKGYMGLLGANVIKRFNVVLDYANYTLYLKPNKYYNSDFNFPLSGIKLAREGEKIFIYTVDESTTAYSSGVRQGDEVVSINGKSESLKSYTELLKKEGESITMTLKNISGQLKVVSLKLQRLL